MRYSLSVAAIVLLAGIHSARAVNPAAASNQVQNGLQDLELQTPAGLTNADAAFSSAISYDPTSNQALLLKALSGLALIQSSPGFIQVLQTAGVTNPSLNLYDLATISYSSPLDQYGGPQLSTNSVTNAQAYIASTLRPQLTNAIARLASVSKDIKLSLNAQQTASYPVSIDYGDVQMMICGLYLAVSATYLEDTYDLNVLIKDAARLISGEVTFEDFLTTYPKFLKFSTNNQRAAALQAFSSANTAFQQAYTFISTQRGPANPSSPHLFTVQTDDSGVMETFRSTATRFAALAASTTSQTNFPDDAANPTILDGLPIYLGSLTTTTNPIRSLFATNSFWGNLYNPGTITDSTILGVFPQMTDSSITSVLRDNGLVNEVITGAGITSLGNGFYTGQLNSYSSYVITGELLAGAYTASQNGPFSSTGYSFLWDGTNYNAIRFPEAQNTTILGYTNSRVLGSYSKGSIIGGFFYQNGMYTPIAYPGSPWTQINAQSGNNVAGSYWSPSNNNGIFLYDGTSYLDISVSSNHGAWVNGMSGSNVFGSYIDDSWNQKVFLYNGFSTTTLSFPGSSETFILGATGSKAWGMYSITTTNGYSSHPFLYSNGVYSALNYPGSTNTWLNWNAPSDQVTGTYTDDSWKEHGFVYDGTNFTSISYPGAYNTTLYGGSVATNWGYFSGVQSGSYSSGLFICRNQTNFTTIPVSLGNSGWGQIYSVDGNNVVGVYATNSLAQQEAFLYDGTNLFRIDVPGAQDGSVVPYGVSGKWVVGNYSDTNWNWGSFAYEIGKGSLTLILAPTPPSTQSSTNPDTSGQVTNTNTVLNGGIIGIGNTELITNQINSYYGMLWTNSTVTIQGAITNNGMMLLVGSNITISDSYAWMVPVSGISGAGSLYIESPNSSVYVWSSNSYSGGTTIGSGSLVVGNNHAIGASNGALLVNGMMDLQGFSISVGALSGAGSITSSIGIGTLTAGVGGVSSVFGGIFLPQWWSSGVSLNKVGVGTLNLTGWSNTLAGTLVDGGILQVSGGLASDVTVGLSNSGAVLLVTNGGILYGTNGYVGGNAYSLSYSSNSSSGNSVIISGSNSLWSLGSLNVGYTGGGNSLVISSGGRVNDQYGIVGIGTNSSVNSVSVTGNGSIWSNTADLVLGAGGSNNSMTIASGGRVVDVNGWVGSNNSSGNLVTVDGGGTTNQGTNGSSWINSQNLTIGSSGGIGTNRGSNALIITNGGFVSDYYGIVGSNSSGNLVIVTGSNSLWSNTGQLAIGPSGSKNTMIISNGGKVYDSLGYVGYLSSSSNNSVLIMGSNSLWSNAQALWIGLYDTGGGNSVTVANGGTLGTAVTNFISSNNQLNIGRLGGGDSAGSVTGNIGLLAGGAINFNQTNAAIFSNSIIFSMFSPNGAINQFGTGTTTLVNPINGIGSVNVNSGRLNLMASSYVMTSTIAGGTQYINGSNSVAGSNNLTFKGTGKFIYDNTNSTGVRTQTIFLNPAAGEATVQLNVAAPYSATLTIANAVGNLPARSNGAVVNFMLSGTYATNGSIKAAVAGSNSAVNPGEFFNGTNYAFVGTNGVIRGINYGTTNSSTNTGDSGSAISSNGGIISSSIVFKSPIPPFISVTNSYSNWMVVSNITNQTTVSINTLNLSSNVSAISLSNGATLGVNGILDSSIATNLTISGGSYLAPTNVGGELSIRVDNPSNTLVIGTPIGGPTNNFSLIKSGAGTLSLTTGSNNYTGPTYITSGTLQLLNGGALGGGNYTNTIFNYGKLLINGNVQQVFGGAISGSGEVGVTNSTLVKLNSSNSYTGGTTVAWNGTASVMSRVQIENKYALGSITGSLVNNGQVDLYGNSITVGSLSGMGAIVNSTGSGTIAVGAGNASSVFNGNLGYTLASISLPVGLIKVGQGTLTLTGSTNNLPSVTVSEGTLQITALSPFGTNTIVANNGIILLGSTNKLTQYIYGEIAGNGQLVVDGSNTSILLRSNSYTGGTTIGSGSLIAANNSALGASSGSLVNNGTLYLSNSSVSIGSLSGNGTITASQGGGTLVVGAGDISSTFNGSFGSGSYPYLTGAGLMKVGSGTLSLTGRGTNAPSSTIVDGGVLQASGFLMSDVTVGFSNGGVAFVVTNGGAVYGSNGYLGGNMKSDLASNGSSGNSAVITGSNSAWYLGNLYVGYAGGGNNMTIASGGIVRDSSGFVDGSNSSGNSVLVTGSNSLWSNSSSVIVGINGSSNSLIITNEGAVSVGDSGTAGQLILGSNYSSSNNSIVVSGSGSSLTNNSSVFTIGANGSGNSLVISNGGTVTMTGNNNSTWPNGLILGSNWSASNNSVVVTGEGSSLNLQSNNLYINYYPSLNNTLIVSNGGRLGNGWAQVTGSASNTTVVVTGSNSIWNNNGISLSGVPAGPIRYYPYYPEIVTPYTMIVSNGGSVLSAGYAALGRLGISIDSNAAVLVTGSNSSINASNGLALGNYSSGLLVVSNGGSVLASTVAIGTNNGSGTLTVAQGGYLSASWGISMGSSSSTLNLGTYGGNDTGVSLTATNINLSSGNSWSGGTINFNQADLINVSATITGGGVINQFGTGTTVLSGNGGDGVISSSVNAGNLQITGILSTNGSVTVNSGGTLSGVGSTGSVSVNSGGTLTPGDGSIPGTLSIGSLTINTGGALNILLGDNASSLLAVNGNASLGGLLNITALSQLTAPSYTFLTVTNGTITGTFDQAAGLPTQYQVVYGSNSVALDAAATILSQPTNQSIGLGQTASFSISAAGYGLNYQWMKDGIALTNQTNNTLSLTNAQSNSVGYYSCMVSDGFGNIVASSNAALNIDGVPFWEWQGLVALYPLNGTSTDQGAFGIHGTPNNITYTNNQLGQIGGAAWFNGSSSKILAGNGSWPAGNSDRSVSTWFRPVVQSGDLFTFGDGSRSYTRFSILCGRGNGFAGPMDLSFVGQTTDQIFNVGDLTSSGWHHALVTMASGTMTMYLDGQVLGSYDQSILQTDGLMPLVIGANSETRNDEFFNGAISSLRVYNRALSSDEVQNLYSLESGWEGANLSTNPAPAMIALTNFTGRLIGDVTLPTRLYGAEVTAIGDGALAGQSNMTSLTIPTNVTTIGSEAFLNCSLMATIIIPDNVVEFGTNVFAGCSSLTNIVASSSMLDYLNSNRAALGLPEPPPSIAIGGNTGIPGYTNSSSNGIVTAGDVSLSGNATIVYTNPNATITSSGTVSISGTNNLISLPGGYLNDSTNILISAQSFMAYYGSSIAVTGPAVGNGILSLDESYTNAGSILTLHTNSTSLYLTVTQNTNPLSQGLVAYYPLNGTAMDQSGNGNNLTIATPGITFAQGRLGTSNNSLEFSSSADYAISAYSIGISGSANRTVSLWMKTPQGEAAGSVLSWGHSSGEVGDAFAVLVDSNKIGTWGSYADIDAVLSGGDIFRQWRHIVIIYSGSVGEEQFYLDGIQQTNTERGLWSSLGNILNTADSQLVLGNAAVLGDIISTPTPGMALSSVRIYDRALSADEVAEIYTSEGGVIESNPSDFNYTSDGAGVTITGYKGTNSSIVIPRQIDGILVTAIGELAFSDSGLTSVTIPSSVTTIGSWAFAECLELTSVTIPSSVTTIGSWAFWGSGLTRIEIPSGVTTLEEGVFAECPSLSAITISDSMTTIGSWAFASCPSLKSFVIPSSVTTLGEGAFYDCSGLLNIEIPDSVTNFGTNVFAKCNSLTNIIASDAMLQYLQSNAVTLGLNLWNPAVPVVSAENDLYVGSNTPNNSLVLSNGTSTYRNTFIGYQSGSSSNLLTIEGTASLINSNNTYVGYGFMIVGNAGSSNSLLIANGGLVTSSQAVIGSQDSASNNEVLVTGAGSLLSNRGSTYIGEYGSGNQLIVSNQGMVNLMDVSTAAGASGVVVGTQIGSSNNSIVVTGTNSVLYNAGRLSIGGNGSYNTVTVSSGGNVVVGGQPWNWGVMIGSQATSSNNTLIVTGPGSSFTSQANLLIGWDGSENSMLISNGGTVTALGMSSIGQGNNVYSSNNSVLVTGSNSLWSNSGTLYVGNSGSGSLTITDGGTVISGPNSSIGLGAEGTGTVLVSNATWSNSGDLDIGSWGAGALTISGGTVSDADARIAYGTGSTGSVTVDNGTWSNAGTVVIGNAGHGSLLISNGLVSAISAVSNSAIIGVGSNAAGDVLVIGSNALWTNNGSLTIADQGSATITVANGANVASKDLIIAAQAGSSATINWGRLGTNDTAGYLSPSGNVVFGAGSWTANFNQSDDIALYINVTGNGVINQLGSGTTAITGSNSAFVGPLNIQNGTFVIGNGTTTGGSAFAGNILNNSTLVMAPESSDAYSVPGIISGAGTVIHAGPGKTTLTATNTYTGSTLVNAGNLQVTGAINSLGAVVVNSGGTLSGTGSVGNVTVNSGATITPGVNSLPGTLTLQSALWAPGGNYNWVLNDASGPAGSGYSSLNIASTLDLSQLSATNRFNINVSVGTNGLPLNFDGLVSTNWTIASFGSITNFSASNFAINSATTNGALGWSGLTNGTLGIATNGNNLELTYTTKPRPTIYIAGSTSFRSVVNKLMIGTYGQKLAGTSGTNATDANASYMLFTNCLVNGSTVDISLSWSGSLVGLRSVASPSSNQVTASFLTSDLVNSNAAAKPILNASSALLATNRADIAFSDTWQAVSGFQGASKDKRTYAVLNDAKVAVVPFNYVANKGSGVDNIGITTAYQLAIRGRVPASLVTGNPTDVTGGAYFTGRDPFSGARSTVLNVSKVGNNSAIQNYKPVVSGGRITSLVNYSATNIMGFDVTSAGNGESSGGAVVAYMTNTMSATVGGVPILVNGRGNTNILVSYCSVADMTGVLGAGIVPLKFEGINGRFGLTNEWTNRGSTNTARDSGYTNIITGKYPLWSYEHILWDGKRMTTEASNTVSWLTNQIGAMTSTNPTFAPNISLGEMRVYREKDGGDIKYSTNSALYR